jgi:hypothetical protein
MAIYHLSAQVIKRSAGRSAVACAAYRSGERLYDERLGQAFDYRRRRGIEAWIQAPEDAPAWAQDREALWNRAEAAERRWDAQVARELDVALPVELDRDVQRALVRAWVDAHCVARGMVADVALHLADAGNPHAHVMLTLREAEGEGFGPKAREWNRREVVEDWREGWEREANATLEREGYLGRIDHRSHAARGLERLPEVHEGPHVRALEARGIATERGAWNRLAREDRALGEALERTRGEREAAERARGLERRVEHWRAAGHDEATARATADVERQAGRTFGDGREALAHCRAEVARSGQEGAALRAELSRVTGARGTLGARERDAAAVAASETVRGRLERAVSRDAREAYAQARAGVERADETLHATGVRDRAELDERTRAWGERDQDWRRDREDRIGPLVALTEQLDAGIRARERVERERAERERGERSRAPEPTRDGSAGAGGERGPDRDQARGRDRGLDLGW